MTDGRGPQRGFFSGAWSKFSGKSAKPTQNQPSQTDKKKPTNKKR